MEGIVLLGVLAAAVALAAPVLVIVALVMLSSLRRRVDSLEQAERARKRAEAAASVPAGTPAPPAAQADAVPETPAPTAAPVEVPPPMPPPVPARAPLPPEISPEAVIAAVARRDGTDGQKAGPVVPPLPPTPPRPAPTPEADFIQRGFTRIWQWFVTGNVPVKVGMLVLLAGVAALLKYASEHGWLRLPIELRLVGISLAALGALVFAWQRREGQRLFALSLQGGAVGVLLLVVFAAGKLYGLLPPGAAFALSAVLIAGLAVLAVLQHSPWLAALGVLAGFLAPIWLSDGSGSHVGLFSWYALVNLGIFAMAWVRPWRGLNLLGFTFTWGIGIAWGVLHYSADKFASSQAFLALFFAFYLLLPLLYARRAEPAASGQARIDGILLFATPLIAFSLQAGLLREHLPLALCALGVAALYAALAWALRERDRLRHLVQGYALLAVGFATLAVPLALSAEVTAAVFALEGAALVWLGLVQQRRLARWSGIGLQLVAALAWVAGAAPLRRETAEAFVVFANPAFMGGVLIALAGFTLAWLYRQRAARTPLALAAYLWGLAWWLGMLAREVFEYGQAYHYLYGHSWRFDLNAFLLLFGLSGWLGAEAHRRFTSRALAATTFGALVLASIVAVLHYSTQSLQCSTLFAIASGPLLQLDCGRFPMLRGGTWVWLLFALLGLRALVCLRGAAGWLPRFSQLIWLLLWAAVLTFEFGRLSTWPDDGWHGLLLALPWLALAGASLYRWRWLCWPLGAAFDAARKPLQTIVFIVLGLWWLGWLTSAGDSAPLPWLALLNPLDLAQIAVLLLLAVWLRESGAPQLPQKQVLLALAALVLVSVITLRCVHHWGGLPWTGRLPGSGLAQTSLTVVWSVLGVAGWIIGSRRGQWPLWLGGALLMGVVLLKLLLIDRGNLGNLLGIGAFIAYGLLCTLIGALAPAPPRRPIPANGGRIP